MAYDEGFAARVEQAFVDRGVSATTKKMMGGLCYMVDDKMCVGVDQDKATGADRLMVRLDPASSEHALGLPGARPMDFTGRPMKGFVFVDADALAEDEHLTQWLDRALEYNPRAPKSKKKSKG